MGSTKLSGTILDARVGEPQGWSERAISNPMRFVLNKEPRVNAEFLFSLHSLKLLTANDYFNP
jgi:hypothetical protein